jgi:uncharacterized protein (TIGR01777 family)
VNIVLAGGSGFLGRKLAKRLEGEGHKAFTLTRRPTGAGQIGWQPDGTAGDLPRHIEGVDAIVNLAGEGIADQRWTAARKEALRSSRIRSTRTLVAAIKECARPPRVFVSGSGIGYYGPHGDEPVTEATPPGDDFLARLCVEWEQAARQASSSTRVVIVRSGLALAGDGGALARMLLPFKLGLGATIGSGKQYFPWIHADDWTAMVSWLIQNEQARGDFNATAPEPVTNREFTKTLGRVLHRPTVLVAPAFALRGALGDLATSLLEGQRVLPAHAEQLGFRFTHRTLEPALESMDL